MRRAFDGMRTGVVLALAAALFVSLARAGPQYPALSGRVVDETGSLSAATRARLTAQLEAHEQSTTNQVVVAVVKSLQGYEIAEYGVGLGRAWRIGTKENNGILLIVAPNERQVRIEVGYGHEGRITDALASAIIREEILPAFRRGNLEEGVDRGVTAILRALEGTAIPAPAQAAPEWAAQDYVHLLIFLMILAVIVGQFWRNARRASRGWHDPWGRRRDGGWPGWSTGSGGRSGSFGGSGRSWSGGGGSFGGGGASGRW